MHYYFVYYQRKKENAGDISILGRSDWTILSEFEQSCLVLDRSTDTEKKRRSGDISTWHGVQIPPPNPFDFFELGQ
jgi:hypothetical protein